MTGIIKVVKGELVVVPDKEQKKTGLDTLDTILITVIVTLMLLYFLGEV